MTCGPAEARIRVGRADLRTQAVIEGIVLRGDQPATGAYVRLLDASGEFTAEVQAGASGDFRFFARSGEWTVRAIAGGGISAEAAVTADIGVVSEVELSLSPG